MGTVSTMVHAPPSAISNCGKKDKYWRVVSFASTTSFVEGEEDAMTIIRECTGSYALSTAALSWVDGDEGRLA